MTKSKTTQEKLKDVQRQRDTRNDNIRKEEEDRRQRLKPNK